MSDTYELEREEPRLTALEQFEKYCPSIDSVEDVNSKILSNETDLVTVFFVAPTLCKHSNKIMYYRNLSNKNIMAILERNSAAVKGADPGEDDEDQEGGETAGSGKEEEDGKEDASELSPDDVNCNLKDVNLMNIVTPKLQTANAKFFLVNAERADVEVIKKLLLLHPHLAAANNNSTLDISGYSGVNDGVPVRTPCACFFLKGEPFGVELPRESSGVGNNINRHTSVFVGSNIQKMNAFFINNLIKRNEHMRASDEEKRKKEKFEELKAVYNKEIERRRRVKEMKLKKKNDSDEEEGDEEEEEQ